MAITSQDVANEALALSSYDGPAVTGFAPTFDTSTAGLAAARLYTPAVAAVARMHGWDFARTFAALALSGNDAPFPWVYEYLYPPNCAEFLEILSPLAASPFLADPNNPVPYDKARGISIVSGVQTSVIWANISPATGVFTGLPLENTWDPLFRADLVRYLAAEFALDLLGKPDLAQTLFDQVGVMQQVGAQRRDT